MPALIVKNDRVVRVSRPTGETVTFVNNDAANDVWFDTDANRLLGAGILAGSARAGTKLVHGGGQLQVANWKTDLFFIAQVDGTIVDVQP